MKNEIIIKGLFDEELLLKKKKSQPKDINESASHDAESIYQALSKIVPFITYKELLRLIVEDAIEDNELKPVVLGGVIKLLYEKESMHE